MTEKDPRKAYESGSVELSKEAHRHHHHHHEEHRNEGKYLGDLVLGGIDGIITTFAIVAGVEGASLSSGVVIVLGLANLLADGCSMAVGNYLSAASERDYYEKERARESWEVDNVPEHEADEIREIYREKGFEGELLENVVTQITSDKEVWVETMMREELGLSEDTRKPLVTGFLTFASFVLFGAIPLSVYLISYITKSGNPATLFHYCVFATGFSLFLIGVLRSKVTTVGWFRGGVEILTLGGIAGVIAYYIGFWLRELAGVWI